MLFGITASIIQVKKYQVLRYLKDDTNTDTYFDKTKSDQRVNGTQKQSEISDQGERESKVQTISYEKRVGIMKLCVKNVLITIVRNF